MSAAMRRVSLALVVLVLSGCGLEFGGGRGATRQGRDIFGLWQGSVIVALLVGGLVWGLILFAVLFAFSYRTQNEVDALSSHPAVTIDVKGFQWQWQFHYRDDDVTVTGLPDKVPTMVLPVDRTVRLVLTSPDVIHSFYVPNFLFKRDAIPGVTNRFDFDVRDKGTYSGRCAEFCGLDHAKMTFEVKAVSMADYRDWIAQQQRAQSGGSP